ncbi:glycerate kinase isoform X1 [Nasonia vitripennis]|uniref:Glycerate kinase n=2 Tax=Nasonia vitripennis TaxID=7425 RepID=A0A7M7GDC9_NASVI|nr:glycerate kinase isoform X1 [Nasonia vitripennis]
MRYFCLLSRKSTSHPNLDLLGSIKRFKINYLPSEIKHTTATMDIDAKLLPCARSQLLHIFKAGVASVMPADLIEKKVRLVDNHLVVDGISYAVTENVYLVGFGKAVAGMAHSLEKLLGRRLKRGIISVPRCSKMHCEANRSSVVEYREGAEHNQPDANSAASTELIVELVENLTENDTLLTLISGGGSALLFSPKPPMTAETKGQLCRRLQNAGAGIAELNHVRKLLSKVKGGGLAKSAYPARVLALVLSDIIGDPIESIASGPTCPLGAENPGRAAIDILRKYNLYDDLEEDVKNLLLKADENKSKENTILDKGKFKHVENIIIGSNSTALQAAEAAARDYDFDSAVLSSVVEGDVKNVSYAYAKLAHIACHALENKFSDKQDFMAAVEKENIEILKVSSEKLEKAFETLSGLGKGKGIVLLSGGEPTVVVKGSGKGGRNQELALRFSLDWLSEIAKDPTLAKYFVLFLSAGTDGQDGPTDAAGAFGYAAVRPKIMSNLGEILEKKKSTQSSEQVRELNDKIKQIEEMLPEHILKRNDSYNFYLAFENGKDLVKTGLTGTNVMDLHFIYIKKRNCECDN